MRFTLQHLHQCRARSTAVTSRTVSDCFWSNRHSKHHQNACAKHARSFCQTRSLYLPSSCFVTFLLSILQKPTMVLGMALNRTGSKIEHDIQQDLPIKSLPAHELDSKPVNGEGVYCSRAFCDRPSWHTAHALFVLCAPATNARRWKPEACRSGLRSRRTRLPRLHPAS